MFSTIMEFFEKLQERKLKKAKKELKKQEGKENAVDKVSDKAEKIIAKKYKSVAFIKKMEDKLLKTKVSPEEVKKHRVKLWVIRILKWILQVLEWLITTLLSLLGVTGILVILIVLVLMLVIYGLLQIDWTISDGNLYKGEDYLGNQYEDCIQGSEVIRDTGYNLSSIAQLTGTMSMHQQNLYRLLGIYEDLYSQESIFQNPTYINEIEGILGRDRVFNFLAGFTCCETGGYFREGYTFKGEENILEYYSNISINHAGYAFLGLVGNDPFDTLYKGQKVATDSFIDYVKNKYIPLDFKVTDTNYAPYGVAVQMSLFGTESLRPYNSAVESYLPALMDEYGILENRDELTAFCKLFMGASYYHSHFGGTEDLLSLWCALWSATSVNDKDRSFDKIQIVYDTKYMGEQNYTPYTAKPYIQGKVSGLDFDATLSDVYFKVDGQDLTVPLWTWVRDNCSNQTAFMEAVNNYLVPKSTKEEGSNAHYGLFAYLVTPKIIKDLGGTIPVVSGGNPEDCDCYEYSGGYIQGVDTSNIKTGEPQGTWSEKLLNVFKSIGNAISKFFGKTDSIENPNNTLSGLGITYEEWRQQSKWKVPYIVQNNTNPEGSQGNIPSDWVSSLGSLGNAGCHIYMYSYMASALTGRVINPTEMTVALRETGGITETGLNYAAMAVGTFNELGLKAVSCRGASISGDVSDFISYFGLNESDFKSTSSETVQKVIDTVLSKNGIVGIAGANGYFTQNTNHYVVITEKTNNGYKVMGYNSSGVYPASNWSQTAKDKGNAVKTTTGDVYNWEYIYKAMSTNTIEPGYNHQRFYAYNPNLGQTQQNAIEFEKFLFIGDSHTVGLKTTLESEGHIVRASSGSTCAQWIGTTSGDKVMGLSNDTITLSDIKSEDINGIVVMLGSNSSTSQEKMKAFLDELKGSYPNTPIFVQKVFPLGSNYTAYDVTTVNSQIETFNKDIEEYCNSNDFYFVDTTASLVDSNGFLLNPDSEGIHLTDVGRPTWWSNIQSAVKMELRTDVVGNINSTRVDCISNGNSLNGDYNVSADHMTSNEADLPGGFARPYTNPNNSCTEPEAPIWDLDKISETLRSRGQEWRADSFKTNYGEEGPYADLEFFYAFDKNTGYRLGMWPKDFDLTPITVTKTYNGLIWPATQASQGDGYDHEGIDIGYTMLTPVYAPADGTIISSSWGGTTNRDFWETAYVIKIKLDNSISYNDKTIKELWLGHFAGIRYRVNSSDESIHIKQGELIGWIGFANAPHLHLTLDYSCDLQTTACKAFYAIGHGELREAGK